MTMNTNAHVMGIAVAILLLMIPITVHGQDGSMAIPPPLYEHNPFDFGNDQELKQLTPEVDFAWRLKVLGEDFREFFTFDPLEKAQLKLEFAEQRQIEIDELDTRGLAIPIEYEQRRIQKLNEASEIINQTPVTNQILSMIIESFETLRMMGELNDIRILYSQLPSVVNASDEVKQRYNAKVNSLENWKEFCIGQFDIDTLKPLRTAVDKLEQQCPKLLELQEQFGRERLRLLVTGQV